MSLSKFQISPEQARYSVTDGVETVRVQLDGGAGRYRKDIANATARVTVNWLFNRSQYQYFKAFFKGSSADTGATPFLIDLLIDEAFGLTEHTVYFIPGSVQLSSTRGLSYVVSAELEVIPYPYVDGYYDAIVSLYEDYDGDFSEAQSLFDALETFVTVELPSLDVFTP